MEERERGILERNSCLLVGNIVMDEEFYRFLRAEHVLPDTMVNDIQSNKCQVTRNRKLLEVLRLRGGDSYRKFRHVLYLSGHQLLADHLYGEDFETKLWRGDELFSKFPKVFHHVSDDCKAKILKFLETKVKEKAVTNAWLTSSSERLDLMESRKIIFDAEKDYKLKLETKSKKVLQMKDDVTRLTEEIKKRDGELSRMQQEVGLMQKNFKEDLATQSRFNAANSNSIMHLKGRFDNFNERVRNVNVAIRRFLEPDNVHVDEDPENVKLSALEKNVRKLTLVARTNIETTSSNTNEKEAILSILRTSSKSKNQTLLEIVQHYVDKQEKGKTALGKELEMLLEVVRGNRFTAKMSTKPNTDLKYLRNQMAMLREEVEHIKKKLEWKDAQITDLIKENSDLKDQTTQQPYSQKTVSFPQLSSNPPGSHGVSRDTPDSTRDMDKAYQQFNRYIEGSTTPPSSRRTSTYRRGSIAEVALETEQPVVLNDVRSRRHSKYDYSGIDILGTSSQYRRSSTDINSLEIVREIKNASASGLDKAIATKNASLNVLDKATATNVHYPRPRPDDKGIDDIKRRNDVMPDLTSEFSRGGRRPSLAELITIYENSQDDHVANEENNKTRLPVLQET